MTPIPPYLFRGDRDSLTRRKVRQNWDSGWLQTNLGDGGRGSDIFREPLRKLVVSHVNETWGATHFLSFSSERVIAESFALDQTGGTLVRLPDDAELWDTAIFTFDTRCLLSQREISPGVFVAPFAHEARTSSSELPVELKIMLLIQDANYRGHDVPVLLIDSLAALDSVEPKTTEVKEAIEKAKWDREWLILPLDPFADSLSGRFELTALLDASCISRKEKFRIDTPAVPAAAPLGGGSVGLP
jgi:hypothetical protein